MIVFDRAKPNELKDEVCMGGIETRYCHQSAVWFQLLDNWQVLSVLCDSCKIEVESYVLNQAVMAHQGKEQNADRSHQRGHC